MHVLLSISFATMSYHLWVMILNTIYWQFLEFAFVSGQILHAMLSRKKKGRASGFARTLYMSNLRVWLVLLWGSAHWDVICYHWLYKEMSYILADQQRPCKRVPMRRDVGSCGVSANGYSCAHHVTWSPNKLWRSTSIFNLWVLWASLSSLSLIRAVLSKQSSISLWLVITVVCIFFNKVSPRNVKWKRSFTLGTVLVCAFIREFGPTIPYTRTSCKIRVLLYAL